MRISQPTLLAGVGNIVAGTLSALTLHLYSAFTGAQNPQPGDFTESAFTGYGSDSTVAWQGPRIYPDGTVGQSMEASFSGVTSVPFNGENVLGWYLTDHGAASVKLWDTLPAPVPMTSGDSQLNLTIQLALDPGMLVGQTVVS